MVFTANNDQTEAKIVKGDRPPLDAITGPAELVSFARKWIALCWQQSPDRRPSFDGICIMSVTSSYFRIDLGLIVTVSCSEVLMRYVFDGYIYHQLL